jgi:hypothetical protein
MTQESLDTKRLTELILLHNAWNLVWILAVLVGLFLFITFFSFFPHIIIISPIIAGVIAVTAESKKKEVEKELEEYEQLPEESVPGQTDSTRWLLLVILSLVLMGAIWTVNYLFSGDPIISFAQTVYYMLLISIIFSSIVIVGSFRKVKKLEEIPKIH